MPEIPPATNTTNAANNKDKGLNLNINKLYSLLLSCKPANVIKFTSRFFEDESIGNSYTSNNNNSNTNNSSSNNSNNNCNLLHDMHALPYLLHNPNEFQSTICSIYCNIDQVHPSISQHILLNSSTTTATTTTATANNNTYDIIYHNNYIYKIDIYKLCQKCLYGLINMNENNNITMPLEVSVCIYMCMYVYICIYMCMYMYIYVHVYYHAYMYMCVCVCVCCIYITIFIYIYIYNYRYFVNSILRIHITLSIRWFHIYVCVYIHVLHLHTLSYCIRIYTRIMNV